MRISEEFAPQGTCNQVPAAPGYEQYRLPHSIVDDTQLDLAALFLLSYRVRQSPGWGTNRRTLARKFGFGEVSFYSAVETLTEAGYMKRTTTKRGNLTWFARERLDFSNAPPPAPKRGGYQHLPREMPSLDGKETWKQIALLTYLNSQALDFALTPKKIARRFNIHVTTARRSMDLLVKSGLASKGKIAGISGYIRLKRRAEAAVTKVHTPDTGKVHTPDIEEERTPDTPYREGKALAPAAAVSMERLWARDPGEGISELPGAAFAARSKSSAGATFRGDDAEEDAQALNAKGKAQGKKGARQERASTKGRKPERRKWIAILDADGEDAIERLKRNDLNGVLHPKLFRYGSIVELAEMLDTAEHVAASYYGARFGRIARDTAVHAIINKLCGWATFAEMDEQGVMTWNYFNEAVWHDVQIAIDEVQIAPDEARYAA